MSSILQDLESKIAGLKTSTAKSNVGTVREVGDGVAKIEGLSDVMLNEMLEFPGGVFGLALNLEENEVGAVLLGDDKGVVEGSEVKTTGTPALRAGRQGPARSRGEHARPAGRRQGRPSKRPHITRWKKSRPASSSANR